MLDLLERALQQENICFERLDGSKSLAQRRQVLHNFRNDPLCIVLLATFGTAGVGSVTNPPPPRLVLLSSASFHLNSSLPWIQA